MTRHRSAKDHDHAVAPPLCLAAPSSPVWSGFLALALAVPFVHAQDVAKPADTKPTPNSNPKSKPQGPGTIDLGKAMEGEGDGAMMPAPGASMSDEAKAKGKKGEPANHQGVETLLAGRPKKVVKPSRLTSAELDRLVDKFLAVTKGPAATPTLDVEFVRRIYLDVTGKLPTPDETRSFVNSNDKAKRAKLIEHLIKTPDYAANWSKYWVDVIRYHATNQNTGPAGYLELEKWLKGEIAANRPWDEVASRLIIADGRADENGAVLLAIAHDGQAVEIAGEVSRIFLGVQIQCAQCHDHPTDSWKRQQFHEFASFFAGERVKRATKPMERPVVFEVVSLPKPRYTMPDLKDPGKNIPVAPKFFLASQAEGSVSKEASRPLPDNLSSLDRRTLIASYITGQDNPWFARAYVNRIWQVLVGEGFYTPVDDIGPERTPRAPEILDPLADEFRDSGYDTRRLFELILNSKTYQREIRSTASASGRSLFASNAASRLRADQIFESLAQALDLPIDVPGIGPLKKAGNDNTPGQVRPVLAARKNQAALQAELKATVGKTKKAGGRAGFTPRVAFNVLFGVDPSLPSDEVLGTIPQTLFLMNSPILNRSIEARRGTVLGEILANHSDNRAALNALYVRVLAREPTRKEVQTCSDYLIGVGDRREAFEDILWSLINSTEFISRR